LKTFSIDFLENEFYKIFIDNFDMFYPDYIGFWGGAILSPERAATYQPRYMKE